MKKASVPPLTLKHTTFQDSRLEVDFCFVSTQMTLEFTCNKALIYCKYIA